jgi:NDP-sugar pyrophosphorylase family protein
VRALILAAGEGSRLRPFTERVAKPMLEVGGLPILEYNVRLAAKHGITDLVINVHYRPEAIVDHFGDGSNFGVAIRYSREPVLLGTAGALNPFRAFFAEATFAVLYGDNLTTCDLSAVIARHRATQAVATIALFHREDPTASGIVALDDAGFVTRFLEKPKPEEVFSNWVNAGVLVLEPVVFDAVPLEGPSDFGRDVLPELLARGQRIAGYKMAEELCWIDSPADYERTLSLWTERRAQHAPRRTEG